MEKWPGNSSLFTGRIGNEKARGALGHLRALKWDWVFDQGLVTTTGPSGSGFMVGMSPMLGLPLDPWALAIRMVYSEVVPQQSLVGQ